MARPRELTDVQIRRALPKLQGWRVSRGALRCEFKFESFKKALQFVVKVAGLAEKADHHPDIDIRYNVVRLALRTHDIAAVSDRDLSLARAIDDQSTARKPVQSV